MESREPSPVEAAILPHLDAAYTLARYLLHDPHDAEDAVQEACLRALRYFASFRGGDARAWLLAIVRRTCYTLGRRRGRDALTTEFDETLHGVAEAEAEAEAEAAGAGPRAAAREEAREEARLSLEAALRTLPAEFREVIVLRELQGLSYREIGEVTGVPIGTVMSRLSRARARLERALRREPEEVRDDR